jgi:hypothetical protein
MGVSRCSSHRRNWNAGGRKNAYGSGVSRPPQFLTKCEVFQGKHKKAAFAVVLILADRSKIEKFVTVLEPRMSGRAVFSKRLGSRAEALNAAICPWG